MTDIEKYELIKYILNDYYCSSASDDEAITKAMPWFLQTIIDCESDENDMPNDMPEVMPEVSVALYDEKGNEIR